MLHRLFRRIVQVLCAYEVVSLATCEPDDPFPVLPPISRVCERHPVLIPVILGGLAVHLIRPLFEVRRHRSWLT